MERKRLNLHGPHRDALAELASVAGHLAAGHGGPARYRKPPSGGSTLPDYSRADLNVICLEVPHRPVTAMCVAGFVLYGLNFEDDFARIGISGDLGAAFQALQGEFGAITTCDAGLPESANTGAPLISGAGLAAALAGPAPAKRMLTMTVARPAMVSRGAPSALALPATHGLPALPAK